MMMDVKDLHGVSSKNAQEFIFALTWAIFSLSVSSSGKRISTGKLFIELNDFLISRQFLDRPLQLFAAHGRRIIAHQLVKLFGKFRIRKRLAHGFPDDLDRLFGRSRRKNVWPARILKSAEHVEQLSLDIRLCETSEFWHLSELGVVAAPGNRQSRMKIHQFFFYPLRLFNDESGRSGRVSIQLATGESNVDFRAGIAGHEFGFF